jgi:hypothetical protein
MTLAEFTAEIQPILDQVHQLEAAIPLAKYAPASQATMTAERNELMRQALAVAQQYVASQEATNG